MGWSLIDHFRTFHCLSKEYELSAGARSVYFALLGEFNAAYWPEELRISDRQMQELSGVKSVATIHDARNLLKSLKVIDFRKGKNRKTIYRLLTDRITSTIQTPTAGLSEHQPSTWRTPGEQTGLFSIPACAQEDIKTCRQEENLSISRLSTRERDSLRRVGLNEDEGATKAAEPAAQTAAGRQPYGEDAETGDAYAPLHERTSPLNSLGNLDNLLEYWERDLRGGRLSIEHQSQIAAWLETYGYEWLEAAMREASDTNGNSHGLNFKLLRGVVERKANPPQKPKPQPLKGGKKNGQREHQYAKPPEYDFLDEWERERGAANPDK